MGWWWWGRGGGWQYPNPTVPEELYLLLITDFCLCTGGFSTFLDNSTVNGEDRVDPNTQRKIHSIIRDQENDPRFQYYNSDAETNSIQSYDQDQLDSPSNLGNSQNYEDLIVSPNNGGFYNADALQSNLRKNKSLSTAVLDLRKLDAIDGDDQGMSLQNEAYDSDSNESSNTPGELI